MGGIQQLAAKAILKNLKALAAQIPAVRARRGTEPVHDLRVASRRVRTALKLLDETVPTGAENARRDAKRRRRWGRELKHVTKALSAARDTDVQQEFVLEFLNRLPAGSPLLRPGVERLLLRLRQRRDEEQRKAIKRLDRLQRRDVLREMRREFLTARAAVSEEGTGADARAPAARQIARLLRRMLAYERFIARPERMKELHEMRIAAKRLRYTMEAVAPLFGAQFDPWLGAAKKVQTDLGDIHDCDVWILQTLPGFLAEERERAKEYFGRPQPLTELKPGIAALLRDRRKRRTAIHNEFLRYWEKLRVEKTWQELKKALRGK